ncbi:photosystem II protein Psb27 [Lyngbya sp. CCY1209]|uniref:photosystem II protein Psb27 n=1 Tax=Lyngbya sp. CCY1209 TaxID=2886103 RepID=UPI002D20F4F4|nr:photosystem II protein Psb27 [Lyngbya sp. CCY1209]MEB3887388.1 photosystem II protein Psb27 [Lyngbya sp. CCY1209]
MRYFVSRLLALVMVVAITLVGCGSATDGLTGNYSQDTLAVVNSLRTAIELPEEAPEKRAAQAEARTLINSFASRYRRDPAVANLASFTTMRTALNALAGHYSSYPNRPVPEKLQQRLEQEFKQVEAAIKRGA